MASPMEISLPLVVHPKEAVEAGFTALLAEVEQLSAKVFVVPVRDELKKPFDNRFDPAEAFSKAVLATMPVQQEPAKLAHSQQVNS